MSYNFNETLEISWISFYSTDTATANYAVTLFFWHVYEDQEYYEINLN